MPDGVDSMCVAGLMELLRTQGLWAASARYAYVYSWLRQAGDLREMCSAGGVCMWGHKQLLEVASIFERSWTAVVANRAAETTLGGETRSETSSQRLQKFEELQGPARPARLAQVTESSATDDGADLLSNLAELGKVSLPDASDSPSQTRNPTARPDPDPRDWKEKRGSKTRYGSSSRHNSPTMASLRAAMIEAVELPLRTLLLSSGVWSAGGSQRSSSDVLAFAAVAVEAFLHNDLYVATRLLLASAKGSFGLVTSHSLDSEEELVVAARGQTMSVAVYPQMGLVLFGSEAAATKVAMGAAIDAKLMDDMTQSRHSKGEQPGVEAISVSEGYEADYGDAPSDSALDSSTRSSKQLSIGTYNSRHAVEALDGGLVAIREVCATEDL